MVLAGQARTFPFGEVAAAGVLNETLGEYPSMTAFELCFLDGWPPAR